MRIILEGCDGTGKTTLAKKLQERYGIDYVHVNRQDPTSYEFYNQTLSKTDVIWDRHFIGEMIYPTVFKRKPNLRMADFESLLTKARQEKVVILILTAGEEQLIASSKKRPEYEEVVKNLITINGQFVAIADVYQLPIINVFEMTFDDIVKIIEKGGNIT
jgi:thymidylate kinase